MSFEEDDDFFGEQTNPSEELLNASRARLDFFVGYSTRNIVSDEKIISESSKGLKAFCNFISITLADLAQNFDDDEKQENLEKLASIKTPEQIFMQLVDDVKPPNIAGEISVSNIVPIDQKSVRLLTCDVPTCRSLLVQHIMVRPCSHMICMGCVKKCVEDGLCPKCGEIVLDISEHAKVTKQIQCLKVKCPTINEKEENALSSISEVFPCVDDMSIMRGLGEEELSVVEMFKRIAQLFVMVRANKLEESRKSATDVINEESAAVLQNLEVYGADGLMDGKSVVKMETPKKQFQPNLNTIDEGPGLTNTLKKRNSIIFAFMTKEEAQGTNLKTSKTVIEAAIESSNKEQKEKMSAVDVGKVSSSVLKKLDTTPITFESIKKTIEGFLLYSYATLDENDGPDSPSNASISLAQLCEKPGCDKTTARLKENLASIITKQCQWKGMLKNARSHLQSDCIASNHKCPNAGCQFEATTEYLHTVHATICPFAQAKCFVCGATGIFRADMLTHIVPCLIEWYATNINDIKKFIDSEKKASEERKRHILNLIKDLDIDNDKTTNVALSNMASMTLRKNRVNGTMSGTLYKTLSKNTKINDGKERCQSCQCVNDCACSCHQLQKIKQEREIAKTFMLKKEEDEKTQTELKQKIEELTKNLEEERNQTEHLKTEIQKKSEEKEETKKEEVDEEEKPKAPKVMKEKDNINYLNYVSYTMIASTLIQFILCFHGIYEAQSGKMSGLATCCVLSTIIPIIMWKNLTDKKMSAFKPEEKEGNNSCGENERMEVQRNFLYNKQYQLIAGIIAGLLLIAAMNFVPYKKEYYEDIIDALVAANSRYAAKQASSVAITANESRIDYASALLTTLPISVSSIFVTNYLTETKKELKEVALKTCKVVALGSGAASLAGIIIMQLNGGSFFGIIKSFIIGTAFAVGNLAVYIFALLILPEECIPKEFIKYKQDTLKLKVKPFEVHQLALPLAVFPQIGGMIIAALYYLDDKIVY